MQWSVVSTAVCETPADLIVFPVFQVKEQADFKPLVADLGCGRPAAFDLKKALGKSGFSGNAESLVPFFTGTAKAGWVLVVGLGKAEELGLDRVRRIAGQAARRAQEMEARTVLVAVPSDEQLPFDDAAFGRCWVEGAEMALSPTGDLKTDKKKAANPRTWKLLARNKRLAELREGVKEAEALAAGCLLARALVNEPPNLLTPAVMAARARSLARAEGLQCTVLGVPQLKKLKMGGILGVGQGSTNPPRLIELKYRGKAKGKKPHIALVGKGVTFDSGGISLKPGAGMDLMKSDMGGAAAVMGAALIVARLKLPVDLTVLVPAAENMPDGGAVKPADVITMASGKTVEVLNTDAEGRLILADALWYAGKQKPDHIIDAATLTGACVVALGKHFAGLLGNSGELIDTLKQAGGETFERVWHLPLVDEHKEIMRGTWSDLQNIGGGREGGALTAAAFLAAFVDEKTSWAHIDIAGPSYAEQPTPTCPKGGTGFGARLMARAVQIIAG
jgi:leucyl aminopeptidase